MAAIRVEKTADFDGWMRGLLARIDDAVDSGVQDTVEQGSRTMQELISSRGTDRQWSRYYLSERSGNLRNHSGVGRIDSGNMLDSVGWNVDVGGVGRFGGEFGWVANQEKYFLEQENGFFNPASATFIEPMNALRDAYTYSTYDVVKNITGRLKQV